MFPLEILKAKRSGSASVEVLSRIFTMVLQNGNGLKHRALPAAESDGAPTVLSVIITYHKSAPGRGRGLWWQWVPSDDKLELS
jgi:hypothetical protein